VLLIVQSERTITQADIDAGKVVNTALLQRRSNDSNRYLWNYRDKRYPTDTPLTQTPRIALVKTAAVGGTGKVGDVITLYCSNQYREHYPRM
jgi:hypothetical protein